VLGGLLGSGSAAWHALRLGMDRALGVFTTSLFPGAARKREEAHVGVTLIRRWASLVLFSSTG